MKKEAEIEMRDESDFRGGIRGRHAARFTASGRDDLLGQASVQDLQTWTMLALYEVQALEAALFTLLVLADGRSPDEALGTAAALIVGREGRSFGELLSSTRRDGLNELDRRLDLVVAERAWLVHRSGYVSYAAPFDPGKTPALVDRLQRLVAEARELKRRVDSFVVQHLADAGLSVQEASTRRGDVDELWRAAA